MTRYEISLTADAEEDIASIHDYIELAESVERADQIAAMLFEAVGSLADMPHRGNVPKELNYFSVADELRELHCRSYRIFYQIIGADVIVFAVADGRRDMQGFLYRRLTR